jgi:hypothetical protein
MDSNSNILENGEMVENAINLAKNKNLIISEKPYNDRVIQMCIKIYLTKVILAQTSYVTRPARGVLRFIAVSNPQKGFYIHPSINPPTTKV